MLDPLVHDVVVSQQTRFGLNTETYPVTVYTYYIGQHGPFTYECPEISGSEQKFEQHTNTQINSLRALGVVR